MPCSTCGSEAVRFGRCPQCIDKGVTVSANNRNKPVPPPPPPKATPPTDLFPPRPAPVAADPDVAPGPPLEYLLTGPDTVPARVEPPTPEPEEKAEHWARAKRRSEEPPAAAKPEAPPPPEAKPEPPPRPSNDMKDTALIREMARRSNVPPIVFWQMMFNLMPNQKNGMPATVTETAAFLVVAHHYSLNPLTGEIHPFRTKDNRIRCIVGYDGWVKLSNQHPAYNGCEFHEEWDKYTDEKGKRHRDLIAVTCLIYRKDRDHYTPLTEYLDECARDTEPWRQWPYRMLRNKAFNQAARLAFGFAGLYDEDEVQRIDEAINAAAAAPAMAAQEATVSRTEALRGRLAAHTALPAHPEVSQPTPESAEPATVPLLDVEQTAEQILDGAEPIGLEPSPLT